MILDDIINERRKKIERKIAIIESLERQIKEERKELEYFVERKYVVTGKLVSLSGGK